VFPIVIVDRGVATVRHFSHVPTHNFFPKIFILMKNDKQHITYFKYVCFMLTILGDVCSYSIITPFLLLDIICLDVLRSCSYCHTVKTSLWYSQPNDASYQSSLVLAGIDKQGYCRHVVNHWLQKPFWYILINLLFHQCLWQLRHYILFYFMSFVRMRSTVSLFVNSS
jgi:hypothetical protein